MGPVRTRTGLRPAIRTLLLFALLVAVDGTASARPLQPGASPIAVAHNVIRLATPALNLALDVNAVAGAESMQATVSSGTSRPAQGTRTQQPVTFETTVAPLPDEDIAEACRYEITLLDPSRPVRGVWVIFE